MKSDRGLYERTGGHSIEPSTRLYVVSGRYLHAWLNLSEKDPARSNIGALIIRIGFWGAFILEL